MDWAQRNRHFILLGAVFILAAFFRFWAAPLSSGPDVAQFWAFADAFHEHGLDFYQYADATGEGFPHWGWGYVYPPVWLLFLGIALFAAPSSFASTDVIDTSWRVAAKTPIIMADLAIGALIYWAVPGSKTRKLIFASLWLFHPTGWYESAVFGQFDAIAVAFLIASLILLERGKDRLAFVFAGLALMTKQYTLFPIAMMFMVVLPRMGIRRFLSNSAVLLGVVYVLSIPFLVTGHIGEYADSIFTPGWPPDYQKPLVYAFSGSGSLLTYLHDTYGWETSGLLHYNMKVLIGVMIVALVLTRFRRITPTQGALVGALLFLAISYQVNYQYLVMLVPLALLAASQAIGRFERLSAIGLAILPAVWLWMFDVSFWFRHSKPSHAWVTDVFSHIGWVRFLPDWAHVSFVVSLMVLYLAYVAMTFLRWHVKCSESVPSLSDRCDRIGLS